MNENHKEDTSTEIRDFQRKQHEVELSQTKSEEVKSVKRAKKNSFINDADLQKSSHLINSFQSSIKSSYLLFAI